MDETRTDPPKTPMGGLADRIAAGELLPNDQGLDLTDPDVVGGLTESGNGDEMSSFAPDDEFGIAARDRMLEEDDWDAGTPVPPGVVEEPNIIPMRSAPGPNYWGLTVLIVAAVVVAALIVRAVIQ